MSRPYQERILSENVVLRKFSQQVQPSQLVWHRDKENRIIEVLSGEGWLFQRDNRLPVVLEEGDRVRVRAGEYHRLIKGDEDLYVKIYKEGKKKKKLSPKQKKIARAAPPEDEITGADFKALNKREAVDHPDQYDADTGKRKKQLDKVHKLKKDADKLRKQGKTTQAKKKDQQRFKLRNDMEGQNESRTTRITDPDILREYLEELVEEQLLYKALEEAAAIEAEEDDQLIELLDIDELDELDERRKKRRKKRKSSKSGRTLSKAVKKSLDKKADRRCLTRGSVYAEFRAGLGAFYSSGSRRGMSAHQWAHARVNSANPSKSWAKVKKRKKCPKKKKK